MTSDKGERSWPPWHHSRCGALVSAASTLPAGSAFGRRPRVESAVGERARPVGLPTNQKAGSFGGSRSVFQREQLLVSCAPLLSGSPAAALLIGNDVTLFHPVELIC